MKPSDYDIEENLDGTRTIINPGKFGGELYVTAALFYDHGSDEETFADGLGWYGLWQFGLGVEFEERWIREYGIIPAEIEYLDSLAGMIIHERDDGIIVSEQFDMPIGRELDAVKKMEKVWDEICEDMDKASRWWNCDANDCPGHYEVEDCEDDEET